MWVAKKKEDDAEDWAGKVSSSNRDHYVRVGKLKPHQKDVRNKAGRRRARKCRKRPGRLQLLKDLGVLVNTDSENLHESDISLYTGSNTPPEDYDGSRAHRKIVHKGHRPRKLY